MLLLQKMSEHCQSLPASKGSADFASTISCVGNPTTSSIDSDSIFPISTRSESGSSKSYRCSFGSGSLLPFGARNSSFIGAISGVCAIRGSVDSMFLMDPISSRSRTFSNIYGVWSPAISEVDPFTASAIS